MKLNKNIGVWYTLATPIDNIAYNIYCAYIKKEKEKEGMGVNVIAQQNFIEYNKRHDWYKQYYEKAKLISRIKAIKRIKRKLNKNIVE